MTAPAAPSITPRAQRGQRGGPNRADRVVFFHAHPDDEAIFTGGTMAMLAAAGCSVTLVVATSGQLGRRPPGQRGDIGPLRETETRTAGALLGVDRVEFLGYRDSGMPGDPANHHPDAFIMADPDGAAAQLAAIAIQQHATAIVLYDAGGIYGHPDHIQVHRVGNRAAQLAGTPTIYETTVDREYLHFVETHLVHHARKTLPSELTLGVPSVMVSTMVDVRPHLNAKRTAIAAHRSQVLATADVITMPASAFARVYGYEWYVRQGPPSTLEHLTHDRAHRRRSPVAA